MKKLAIIALSLATAFSSVAPAQAFPTIRVAQPQISDVDQVAQRRYPRRWHGGRHWSGNRHWNGNRHWRGNRHWNGNRYYGNRYRGRHYNGGYYGRYYDNDDDIGWLFGGLAAGAIIGGLIAQPGYYDGYYGGGGYYGGNSHISWCYARYRSYRAYDNTYQPYYGPRRQCIGP